MKSIIKISGLLLLSIGLFTGCVNDDDYSAPQNECVDPGLTANKSVADVKLAATSTPVEYMADDIIEGYVTSNDEKGNFYKTVYLQTLSTDGSLPIGFSLPLDLTTSFGEGFYPGRKVYIKLKGLHTAIVDGILSIGGIYQPNPNEPAEIGRLNETEWKNFVFLSCDEVAESQLVTAVNFTNLFQNQYQGLLVDIQSVQFADSSLGRKFYDVDSGGGATNHLIESATLPQTGGQEFIRFSSFASFAGQMVPEGSGTIRGVLTKYQDDFQFLVRSQSDLHLDGPRVDPYPAVGGSAIVYSGSFTENFESYSAGSNTTGQYIFPKYINDAVVGSRYWRVRSNGTPVNKFIQMTSFGGTPENNRTLFIVPVDMTAANTFKFDSRASFLVTGHNSLKVYYSMDYIPGSDITDATLVNITSNFSISTGTTSTGAFTPSGTYNIPSNLTGNGYFIFEYIGSGISDPAFTTNMDLDNIVVN
ncbi:hypothetical protein HUK80_10090 [Flavobacterium sp. MAH-1]|uniref:Choice-of-anchor J domain-containing protein n=1 Tax=Flavobacterium agri TaxID=2743471 RepID=A0A7Y9C6B1_9FLAO|nr:DUF5689 domain-containing protein [Flavobacterium agri]NUY81245.1 hypothetical protein [Flavobacterium agri]NYA71269.1 choice-of-anchor J domain-containing protein [Flavobacterium agri]